ncbi:MAG: cache domain-containing protein [Thermodesulfovibrionales bacterium]|nr:cache domain-containing protein [Thermodesulfovibrionales bacterium]
MKTTKISNISFATLLTLIIIEVAVILTLLNVIVVSTESRKATLQSAEHLFTEVAEKNIARINLVLDPLASITSIASLKFTSFNDISNDMNIKQHLLRLKDILDENQNLMSAYVGFNNGFFYQVFATRGDQQIIKIYNAPEGTKYIDRVINNQGGTLTQRWRYFDNDLRFISQKIDTKFDYDPRMRPWYKSAMQSSGSIFTPPYIFSSSRLPGITCAKVLKNDVGVMGIDLSLSQMSELLSSQKIGDSGFLWVIDSQNKLVAFPGVSWKEQTAQELKLPDAKVSPNEVIKAVAQKLETDKGLLNSKPFFIEVGDREYLVSLRKTTQKGLDLIVAITAPLEEIAGYIKMMNVRSVIWSLVAVFFIIPLAFYFSCRASKPIGQLIHETDKIQRFDFSPSAPIDASIKEIKSLIDAVDTMRSTIKTNTESLIETQAKLEKLLQGSIALSSEKNMASLITIIFKLAKEISNSDGGVLYLKEGDVLEVELLSIKDGSTVLGGLSENPVPRVMIRPEMMAFLSKDTVLHWACSAYNNREIVFCNDKQMSLFPTGLQEEPKDYVINALMSIPIITLQGKVIGVMQLFNSTTKDNSRYINEQDSETIRFIKSLASQAAVSLDNRNLIKSLNDLFNALIEVIASSIDAKSQYTSGHCTRVPELALIITKAVSETNEGEFKDFKIDTEEAWDEMRVASWLHDCGKVVTPEYVVDKATKLETICNRIHEIRMRFEVLRRDAEIDYYKALLEHNADIQALQEELQTKIKELEEDFAFVATCNVGGEFMSDAHKERLLKTAQKTWLRYFSDRLGISQEELRLKGNSQEPPLPVVERLLADKPEHIIPWSRPPADLTDINGNPLKIPDNEYNRGELYNLLITRGTLTNEDRFKIQEHIIMTHQMLSKVPFPETMQNVVDIASSHHETLIGTGYPFKKSMEHLSVQGRILAIADIFEALTSRDRPYKKAKTLSEALKIMTFMRKDKHIDSEIFDIFLKSGACMRYAEQYLLPEQIDVTDITLYLSKKEGL